MIKVLSEKEKDFIFKNRFNLTVSQIAKHLNRNKNTIRNFLARNNFQYKKVWVSNNPRLTQKEEEIMDLISKGYSLKDIEEKFFITRATIKSHLVSIYQKYNLYLTCKERGALRVRAVLIYLAQKGLIKTIEGFKLC